MEKKMMIGKLINFIITGGSPKYRVRGNRVEKFGGGCGPYWGFCHFSDFKSTEDAREMATKWAEEDNAILL